MSRNRNLPLAFTLLVFGVYLLTMSGHTYSPDEETMLATSQALAAHGTWELPSSRALVEVTGVDGKRYSQYGPGQPAAALPWVVLGRFVGGLFPKDQSGFPLRLILASYNALIMAAICGLFVGVGLALGYSRRASLFTAGVLAFATFLWPHSRTFFAEPLTGLCLFASFYLLVISPLSDSSSDSRRNMLILLSGVVFAGAIATKAQYASALPAYLLYVIWRPVRSESGGLSANLRLLIWWLSGLAVGIVPLLVYNAAIFGSPFTTGYGGDLHGNFKTPFYEGLPGLLVSPGKGFLWYAPPVLLSLLGLQRFVRRHRVEAAFIGVLAVCIVALFSIYTFWPGDGSWGPRYLMPIVPFCLLPALSVVEGVTIGRANWGRFAVSAVVAIGFLVNLPGVLVNFDTYINVVNDDATRYWQPGASPIVGHAVLLEQRLVEGVSRAFPLPGTILFKSGFSYSEGDKARGELLPRWTTGAGVLEIRPSGNGPLTVTLRLSDHRPPELPRANVSILANGRDIGIEGKPVPDQPVSKDYAVAITSNPTELEIRSDTWNPSKVGQNERNEDIGVRLNSITVTEGSQSRSYALIEALPPPGYYPQPRWYYDPGTHHLADLWPVYMVESGMGRKAMLALGLPLVVVGLLCVVVGLGWVRVTRKT